jgi:hypothetical protein
LNKIVILKILENKFLLEKKNRKNIKRKKQIKNFGSISYWARLIHETHRRAVVL